MAMTLSVGGRKDGFSKESFLAAMEESGITCPIAERIINRLCRHRTEWFDRIDRSFLPPDLKESYKTLLEERLGRLA